jgi:anti-sigma factor RsiW
MTGRLDCNRVRLDLGAWIDDELIGERRQEMARHLESCDTCQAEVAEWHRVGECLRQARAGEPSGDDLAGLSSGVFARLGAEDESSWRALAARAVDGWHWAIVGAGALVGTVLNTAMLVAILMFGPAPANQESLSAVLTNMSAPAGYVFAFVSPVGHGQATSLWQVNNGLPAAPRFVTALAAAEAPRLSEAALVQQLTDMVAPHGPLRSLGDMGHAERAMAEALFDEITRLRFEGRAMTDTRQAVKIHSVRLVTSVTVKL